MISERVEPTEPICQSDPTLDHIPEAEFVAAWEALVGEPPATMLDSRSEMIRILVKSVPLLSKTWADTAN
jgi:hypothetical protein